MALASALPSSSTASAATTAAATTTTSTVSSRRTLTITLSSVFSVVGFLLLVGFGFACLRRRRRRRGSLFPRGISPIGDDEIETWKVGQVPEKACEAGGAISDGSGGEGDDLDSQPTTARLWHGVSPRTRSMTVAELHARQVDIRPPQRARGISLDSAAVAAPPLRRSPSKVIIDEEPSTPRQYYSTSYGIPASAVTASSWTQHQQQRHSEDLPLPQAGRSARSLSLGQSARMPIVGRFSLDQDRDQDQDQDSALTQMSPQVQSQFLGTQLPAAVHARAPNSRTGLTDETIPGDPSFLPSPRPLRRQTSRLVKQPPMAAVGETRGETAASSAPRSGGASSNGGGHSFWHVRTRSGRSSSVVSGRSVGSEVELQQQSQQQSQQQHHHHHHHEEEVPPLPSTPLPAHASQPYRQRSTGDLAQASAVSVSDSSRSRVYLHHQHSRFHPPSISPQPSLDEDDNTTEDQGTFLGGLSPRPPVPDQRNIGQAIG